MYEWRRIVLGPDGNEWENLNSGWYGDNVFPNTSGETLARSLLNREYPEPTPTGFRYVLQRRRVGEVETMT